MKIGGLFEGVGHLEQIRLAKHRPQELEPDGQALG